MSKMHAWIAAGAGLMLVVGLGSRPVAQDPAKPAGKKIIFLAGPKDHGAPGRHEHEKDLRMLATALESSPNLKGIRVEVVVGKAPTDLAAYADVAAIVIESSSDRDARETHPLFPPEPETTKHTYDQPTLDFLKGIDARVKAGMGVVVLHYANWAEHWVARRYYLDWTGGLWVQGVSRNPVDQWTMTPKSPDHPILRGVKEWNYRDEVFCRFHPAGRPEAHRADPGDAGQGSDRTPDRLVGLRARGRRPRLRLRRRRLPRQHEQDRGLPALSPERDRVGGGARRAGGRCPVDGAPGHGAADAEYVQTLNRIEVLLF